MFTKYETFSITHRNNSVRCQSEYVYLHKTVNVVKFC